MNIIFDNMLVELIDFVAWIELKLYVLFILLLFVAALYFLVAERNFYFKRRLICKSRSKLLVFTSFVSTNYGLWATDLNPGPARPGYALSLQTV